MNPLPDPRPACLAVLLAAALAGCGSIPRTEDAARRELDRDTLRAARSLVARADRFHHSPETALVYRLRAAEIAWGHLNAGDAATATEALGLLNRATGPIAVELVAAGGGPLTAQFAGYVYQVRSRDTGPGVMDPARFSSVTPARLERRNILKQWHERPGAGEPLVPDSFPSDPRLAERFTPPGGFIEDATAVLSFAGGDGGDGGRVATLRLLDPTFTDTVRLGERTYPLAADFSAAVHRSVDGIPELFRALSGLLIADRAQARLVMTEPYDPDRTPVILIHGLASVPRMWRDVINDLRSRPELSRRYQFWIYEYPTGWPLAYSSLRLREEIEALEEIIGEPDDLVLIGHSMGGLVSRFQVITPERALWDAHFREHADDLYAELPPDHLIRRALIFEANPEVDRVIFISTPHRGSRIADLSIVTFVTKLIRLPGQVVRTVIDLPFVEIDRRYLTSIHGLSPGNPTFAAIEDIPIEAKYHSIIGDRGRGDTPNSSDGVVAYWSSHLDGAQSELIVPTGHGAFKDPAAIAEIMRILRVHAGLDAPVAAEAAGKR